MPIDAPRSDDDAAGEPAARDAVAPGAVVTGLVTAIGLAAAVRRRREVRDERSGVLAPLAPDEPGEEPVDRLGAALARWRPTPPRTALGRAATMAWAAPATVVGLLLAALGRGEVTWHPDLGAWVATDVGGLSAMALRRAGMSANTLGHTVVCTVPAPSQRLLDHEAAHVRQFERLGLGLYPLYLVLSARHGYRANPLEVGARLGAARRAAARTPLDSSGRLGQRAPRA